MIKFIITLSFIFLSVSMFAQQPPQRPGGGMPGAGGGMPGGGKMPGIVGRIYGKITDATTNQPIPYASVVALRPMGKRDSIIGGMLSLDNGDFNLDNLPIGGMKIKVSVLGYKDMIKSAALFPPDIEVDLGDLKMQTDTKVLGEVTVTAEKSGMVMNLDKKTFNVDKNITSTGGTAEDVLKNVPSVSVDADGNVKLRNNSPTVFVDGKPTLLNITQIPADQIESVEVITNPSAKYDASTTGGILNLVLKKYRKAGYNGMIGVGVGFPERYNATAYLNVNQGKWNVGLFYNLNAQQSPVTGYSYRTTPGKSDSTYFNQNTTATLQNIFQKMQILVPYFIIQYEIQTNDCNKSASKKKHGGFIRIAERH